MAFDMDRLTPAAKAEAMRYGHTAVCNHEELISILNQLHQYLLKGEHFAVKPLGIMAGSITMYSVRIIPVVKVRKAEHS